MSADTDKDRSEFRALRLKWDEAKAHVEFLFPDREGYAEAVAHKNRVVAEVMAYYTPVVHEASLEFRTIYKNIAGNLPLAMEKELNG